MSKICRFTVLASRDLEAIIDYVAEQSSIDIAETVLTKVNQKCQQLMSFPGIGRKRDELSTGVRSVPVDNYLVFYRLIEDGIEVLRIVSGYRDLEVLFEEEDPSEE
ncbi:MAG: type II toxin-antitoxin system RelE/ParE family toxin [Cyanobacteria bacterium P01_F01_bin.86]